MSIHMPVHRVRAPKHGRHRGRCVDMSMHTCLDMCLDMCIRICAFIHMPVRRARAVRRGRLLARFAYTHVYKSAYTCIYMSIHMCIDVSINIFIHTSMTSMPDYSLWRPCLWASCLAFPSPGWPYSVHRPACKHSHGLYDV